MTDFLSQMEVENFVKWDARRILNIEQSGTKYALVLLNRPILFAPEYFLRLWNNGLDTIFL